MGFICPLAASTYQGNTPLDQRWRTFELFPTLTTPTQWGSATLTEVATAAAVASTATTLQGRSHTTTTTLNNVSSWVTEPVYGTSHLLQCQWNLSMSANTTRRVWAGFSDVVPATMAASGTPTANYVGLRFDSATDATWRAVADNASGTPTDISAGVAPTTTSQIIGFIFRSSSSVDFFINGVYAANIATAKIPATSVNTLRCFMSITNLSGGATRAFTYYFMSGRARVV